MPSGILAGLFLGAAHFALFHRGVSLAFAAGPSSAARLVALWLAAVRLLLTASAGYLLVRSGVSPVGLGIGLLIALYVYRVGLMMIRLPERGRV